MLLTIDHPSSKIFTYNVDQKTPPWPVPVILGAPKDQSLLNLAQHPAGPSAAVGAGRLAARRALAGDVVGRLDRGKGRWLAISTPVTSRSPAGLRRGPGIAGFLAMARLAATRWPTSTWCSSPPRPRGRAWRHGALPADGAPGPRHLGVGAFRRLAGVLRLAPRRWTLGTDRAVDTRQRLVLSSQAIEASVARRFKDIVATPLTGARAASASCATSWRRVIHASSAWQVPIPSSTRPSIRRRRPALKSWNRSSGPLPRPWTTRPLLLAPLAGGGCRHEGWIQVADGGNSPRSGAFTG